MSMLKSEEYKSKSEEEPPKSQSETGKHDKSANEQSQKSGWRTIPTLFTEKRYKILFGSGIIISTITVIFVTLALSHEMSGLFAIRPWDVAFFIIFFCFMIILGILLYPFLVVHFRERILEQETFNTLSKKFQEGNAALAEELEESGVIIEQFDDKVDEAIKGAQPSGSPLTMAWEKVGWTAAWDKVSAKHPDFAYLYNVVDQHFQVTGAVSDEKQTFEQKRQDYLRGLIRATAAEHIEDSTFGAHSYELPVIFCMLSVAFGFFVLTLVPFLGITEIALGESSINLVWAAGGFTGAYLYSLYPLFQRYTRRDLPPRAFLDYAIKVFLGTMAVTVFGNLFLLDYAAELQFSMAAVLGSVPFVVLNQARKQVFSKLSWPGKVETVGSKDVSEISGITYEYSLRLHEEGVMNIQQLAFANSEKLSERTMFNKDTVCDWKDEAILRLLTGNIPMDGSKENPEEEDMLYCALNKVGINSVSDLSNFLECEEPEKSVEAKDKKEKKAADGDSVGKLVKLLGWTENVEEYKYLLTRICDRGEELLGEVETSVATRAINKELLSQGEEQTRDQEEKKPE
jgi:hypothetical protein